MSADRLAEQSSLTLRSPDSLSAVVSEGGVTLRPREPQGFRAPRSDLPSISVNTSRHTNASLGLDNDGRLPSFSYAEEEGTNREGASASGGAISEMRASLQSAHLLSPIDAYGATFRSLSIQSIEDGMLVSDGVSPSDEAPLGDVEDAEQDDGFENRDFYYRIAPQWCLDQSEDNKAPSEGLRRQLIYIYSLVPWSARHRCEWFRMDKAARSGAEKIGFWKPKKSAYKRLEPEEAKALDAVVKILDRARSSALRRAKRAENPTKEQKYMLELDRVEEEKKQAKKALEMEFAREKAARKGKRRSMQELTEEDGRDPTETQNKRRRSAQS